MDGGTLNLDGHAHHGLCNKHAGCHLVGARDLEYLKGGAHLASKCLWTLNRIQ